MPSKRSIVSIVLVVLAMGTIECCVGTALFGVFLETNKHQNLMRLSSLISIAYMQSMSPRFITSAGPSPVRIL